MGKEYARQFYFYRDASCGWLGWIQEDNGDPVCWIATDGTVVYRSELVGETTVVDAFLRGLDLTRPPDKD